MTCSPSPPFQGVPLEEIVEAVVSRGAPISHSTRPDNVRLHDDKVRQCLQLEKGEVGHGMRGVGQYSRG